MTAGGKIVSGEYFSFSPDCTMMAAWRPTSSFKSDICVYRLDTFDCILRKEYWDATSGHTWSRDGQSLVILVGYFRAGNHINEEPMQCERLCVRTHEVLSTVSIGKGRCMLSAHGEHVACTPDFDGIPKVVEAETGGSLMSLEGYDLKLCRWHEQEDDLLVAIASNTSNIHVFSVSRNELLSSHDMPLSACLKIQDWPADGPVVSGLGLRGQKVLYMTGSNTTIRLAGKKGLAFKNLHLAISPNGRYVAASAQSGLCVQAKVFDTASRQVRVCMTRDLLEDESGTFLVGWLPNSSKLFLTLSVTTTARHRRWERPEDWSDGMYAVSTRTWKVSPAVGRSEVWGRVVCLPDCCRVICPCSTFLERNITQHFQRDRLTSFEF